MSAAAASDNQQQKSTYNRRGNAAQGQNRQGGRSSAPRSGANRRGNNAGGQGRQGGAQQVKSHLQQQLLSPVQQLRLPSSNDIAQLVKSSALIGSANVAVHMRSYMFNPDLTKTLLQNKSAQRGGANKRHATLDTVDSAFDLRQTWNQLNLAATVLASVVDPASQVLFVASNERSRVGAQRTASLINAQSILGRYVPGTLSNPAQKTFIEPTWIVCASGTEDVQAIKESASSNSAVIAFCDSTANLNNIDIPIACNTKGRLSIGVMFYMLARQTLRHMGKLPFDEEIENLFVDHFIQQKKSNKEEEAEEADNAKAGQNEEQSDQLAMEADSNAGQENWEPYNPFGAE